VITERNEELVNTEEDFSELCSTEWSDEVFSNYFKTLYSGTRNKP